MLVSIHEQGLLFWVAIASFKRGKGQVGRKKTWEREGHQRPLAYLHYYYWLSTFSFAYNFHQEEPNYNFNAQFPKSLTLGALCNPILGIIKAYMMHLIRV
jgi:hypothetical protein